MGKFIGGVQGQTLDTCRCHHCIWDTRPSEMQLLAFGRPFSRRVARVGEGESRHSWWRAGVSLCPGHLVGPWGRQGLGKSPKGVKINEESASTKPEEFGHLHTFDTPATPSRPAWLALIAQSLNPKLPGSGET